MTFQKHFKQIWEENEKCFIQKLNAETRINDFVETLEESDPLFFLLENKKVNH
jgi:hypothetical protein